MWFLADITDLKRYQDACEFKAHIDPLTGLPNRVLLADRMDQALALAQRHGYVTALCYLDLDGFKAINDEHGHDAGDEVLKEVARRLQAVIRDNDTAARLGGDEFVLLLTHVGSPQEVERLLQRVLDAVASPVATDVALVGVTASIGVAMAPAQGLDGPGLLRRADTAMYAAKRLGRRQMHFFRDAPHAGPGSIH
jgi:diguanylate cyclase (GGDEF)-like protein